MSDTVPQPNSEAAAPELHRADPAERRRTLWLMVLTALVGLLLLMALQHELGVIQTRLEAGDANLATGRFVWLARGAFALLALVGVVTGVVIGLAARAVIREQRYPHAAARLIRDRVVVRGLRAVRIGQLGLALALAFALVGCAGAALGWRMLASFQ